MKDKKIKGSTWLFAGITFLIIVHFLFKIPAPFSWLEHIWEAGDLISFVGTLTLGYVAYWQTYKANVTEDRMLKLEETRYKLELRPFLMVADYSAYIKNNYDITITPDKTYVMVGKPEKDDDDVLCIEFSLMNTTNSYVSAKYFDAVIMGGGISWIHRVANQKDDVIRLKAGEIKPLVLYAPPTQFQNIKGNSIRLIFFLENRFGDIYAERFNIIITALTGNVAGCSPTGKWFISMSIQDYSISQFENKGNGELVEIQENNPHV